ncbi:hypothetical protein PRZ48_001811 [Zasmidium cellare]|uniref:Ribosomal RNA-processing protein 42 n=1 Tax=Zasmidium cellare TaxID=395010 RepID=A0ABR0F299_ZASCE|nr:hypothetical protein PRZ48_001811 [Zasmidium cellare]
MAPYTNIPLSPAELSYLHTSLAQDPPIRPDGRSPTQFRPLVAETDILPSANGSARICFADGTEAVVGVKAEVERTGRKGGLVRGKEDGEVEGEERGEDGWLDVSIEIPGTRDDDALPVFLAAMLTEALLADGELKGRLVIGRVWHWRLFVDILLLSQPLSYPLPLLSLTTHLALLSTRLPALISQKDEDPLFNDDWEASTHLFPRQPTTNEPETKPPITLLVMTVGTNILFDPSSDEIAVADAIVAISATEDSKDGGLKMVALRTVDPPSRLTSAGVPTQANTTAGGGLSAEETLKLREKDAGATVWRPPRGGVSRTVLGRMIKKVVEKGGVGEEVLEGLRGVKS